MAKSEFLHLLGWCLLIYFIILSVWALFFIVGRDWLYNLHGKWFSMPVEKFNAIHYMFLGFFKIILIVFFLVPYLVLRAM